MRRIAFELELEVVELINVPMFDDTECFMVSTISNSKLKNNYKKLHISSHTTPPVPTRNHKVKFGPSGIHNTEFRLQAQSNSKGEVLSDKWLCISFMMKHKEHQELLGALTLNLTEYVNEKGRKELRFLLERSKTNTIVKLNLQIRHLEHDESVTYQTSKDRVPSAHTIESAGLLRLSSVKSANELSPKEGFNADERLRSPIKSPAAPGRLGLPIPSPSAKRSSGPLLERATSRNNSLNIPGMTMPSTASSSTPSSPMTPRSPRSPKSSKCAITSAFSCSTPGPLMMSNAEKRNTIKDISTQTMMNEACESAINDISLLDDLINKTYRFTWQLRDSLYDEFTPAECVKDIIERNGNGWRKNDEGVDMVDVVENEFRESSIAHRNRSSLYAINNDNHTRGKHSGEPDIFAEFKGFENVQALNSDDDDSDDSEFIRGRGRLGGDDDSVFYSYYTGDKRKNKVKRYKPLTEAEVREDLRSWHITVKE